MDGMPTCFPGPQAARADEFGVRTDSVVIKPAYQRVCRRPCSQQLPHGIPEVVVQKRGSKIRAYGIADQRRNASAHRARSRTARTETPGPLGQTPQPAIVRLMGGPVTTSEASVRRLDRLGHDRYPWIWTASNVRPGTGRMEGGGQQPDCQHR